MRKRAKYSKMATATGTEWREARQWLIDARVIPVGHPVTKPTVQLEEFAHSLTDGVFLCMVLNKLKRNAVAHFHPRAKLQVRRIVPPKFTTFFPYSCSFLLVVEQGLFPFRVCISGCAEYWNMFAKKKFCFTF